MKEDIKHLAEQIEHFSYLRDFEAKEYWKTHIIETLKMILQVREQEREALNT